MSPRRSRSRLGRGSLTGSLLFKLARLCRIRPTLAGTKKRGHRQSGTSSSEYSSLRIQAGQHPPSRMDRLASAPDSSESSLKCKWRWWTRWSFQTPSSWSTACPWSSRRWCANTSTQLWTFATSSIVAGLGGTRLLKAWSLNGFHWSKRFRNRKLRRSEC